MSAEGFAAVPNWLIRDLSKEDLSIHGIAVYAALASHSGKGGIHPGMATIAREARCSENTARKGLAELVALGVVKVSKRTSSEGDSDTNSYTLRPNGRARGGARREVPPARVAGGVVHVVTHGGASSAPEEEPLKKNPSRTPPIGGGATRIPEPFIVTVDMRRWAADEVPLVDVDRATRMFVDYWRARSRDAAKKDWPATWRNWLRKEQADAERRPLTPMQRAQQTMAAGARVSARRSIHPQREVAS